MVLLVFIIILLAECLLAFVLARKFEREENKICYIRPILTEYNLEVMRRAVRKQKKF